MTAAFITLAFVTGAIVIAFLKADHAKDARHAAQVRELLNRIQRPDVIVPEQAGEFEVPELEPDEIDLVGQVAPAAEDYAGWDAE